jgi:WSC domain
MNPVRSLSGITFANYGSKITSSGCAAYCVQKGYSIAGTEYAGQCFCGNQLVGSQKAAESVCNMPCEGNATEICGGSAALSVFAANGVSLTGTSSQRRLR